MPLPFPSSRKVVIVCTVSIRIKAFDLKCYFKRFKAFIICSECGIVVIQFVDLVALTCSFQLRPSALVGGGCVEYNTSV